MYQELHLTTTKLLPKHDNPRRKCSTPVARNSKQLHKLGEEVLSPVCFALELYSYIGIVCVSSGLNIGKSESLEGLERFICFAVLDIPSE